MPAPESARDAARLSGRLVDGRYRIGAPVARGGMASVYEATDIRLDRQVAVKVMHPGLGDDDEFAARFVREARHAARLSHPNVVAVHDQGDDDGTVFLVMEYVPGHTLRDVLRKEAPMPPTRALELMEPVLSALAAAHRAGLAHRDVKPENVLIAAGPDGDDPHHRPGQVKVADFGLARAVSADTQHTATGGVLIGTVSYLAPELVVEGRADARADVYAAGVVLYELLTGRKPHEGESPIQVAYKHVHEDVPPPSALVPGIPGYVDALVARATARERDQRPADAAVLLHQVHRVSQALRDGLDEDEELTADLTPVLRTAHPGRAAYSDHADHTRALEIAAAGRGGPPARPDAGDGSPRPARPRRRRWRGPVALLLSLLLAGGVGVGAWWYGWERWTLTPGVLRMTEAEATDRLDRDGLEAAFADPEYSETVPRGEVLSSDPEPGGRVLDGGTVTLVLSLGKERYDVPRLAAMTEDRAQDAIAGANLRFGKSTERFSEKVPEGRVISSDPKRGTRLRRGSAVDLVVSKGRRPIRVGSWVGEPLEQVEEALDERGLEAEVTGEEFSDSVPEGHVVSQQPTGGTLFRGDPVRLVVSKGPELVEVPRVVASGVDAATERLEALGFDVDVREDSGYIGLRYVFRSDPGAGTMLPKGSTVVLYLI